MPEDQNFKTRDILYTFGITPKRDSLHIFINHWPSRFSGQLETESARITTAQALRKQTDSLLYLFPKANIIITGDFNDTPNDPSLKNALDSKIEYNNIQYDELYNISYHVMEEKKTGTYKHKGIWITFDQWIVSGSLLSRRARIPQ